MRLKGGSLRDSEGIWVEGQEAKVFFFKYVAEPVHVESMLIKRHKMTLWPNLRPMRTSIAMIGRRSSKIVPSGRLILKKCAQNINSSIAFIITWLAETKHIRLTRMLRVWNVSLSR